MIGGVATFHWNVRVPVALTASVTSSVMRNGLPPPRVCSGAPRMLVPLIPVPVGRPRSSSGSAGLSVSCIVYGDWPPAIVKLNTAGCAYTVVARPSTSLYLTVFGGLYDATGMIAGEHDTIVTGPTPMSHT